MVLLLLGPGGGRDERRREQLGEEERAQRVGAEVQLVALRRELVRSGARLRDARVVEEDVERRLSGGEGLDGRLDGAEVRQVEVEVRQAARGVRVGRLDVVKGALGSLLGAAADVDLGVLGVEDPSYLFAGARVAAGDEVDLGLAF